MLRSILCVGAALAAVVALAMPAVAQTAHADIFTNKVGPWQMASGDVSKQATQFVAGDSFNCTDKATLRTTEALPPGQLTPTETIIIKPGVTGKMVSTANQQPIDGLVLARLDDTTRPTQASSVDVDPKLAGMIATAERMISGTYAWDLSGQPSKR